MGLLSKIIGGSAGEVIQQVGEVVDRFVTTDAEKSAAKLELERLLQKDRERISQDVRSELEAKERILVAELTQGDAYTKRARPTIIYAGLAMMAWNYCLCPLAGFKELALPEEFWLAWGGVVGVYSWGRTTEKRGPAEPKPERKTPGLGL